MRYQWPKRNQSAAALSFDVDAESGFLFREPEKAKRSLGDLEERRFGPRVLRTETAGLAALAVVLHVNGELG